MQGLEPIRDVILATVSSLQSHPGYEVATLFLAGVFLWSGAAKLRQPGLAAMAIADFGLVSRPRPWQGLSVGMYEFGLGLALLVGQAMGLVLALSSLTMAAFTALVAIALAGSKDFACFCFGGDDQVSRLHLCGILVCSPLQRASGRRRCQRQIAWGDFNSRCS